MKMQRVYIAYVEIVYAHAVTQSSASDLHVTIYSPHYHDHILHIYYSNNPNSLDYASMQTPSSHLHYHPYPAMMRYMMIAHTCCHLMMHCCTHLHVMRSCLG